MNSDFIKTSEETPVSILPYLFVLACLTTAYVLGFPSIMLGTIYAIFAYDYLSRSGLLGKGRGDSSANRG